MKVIQVPAEKEEALYFSDFSGKPLDLCGPDITLTLDYGYGSIDDGTRIVLHLDDSDIRDVIELLSRKTNTNSKLAFFKKYYNIEDK